MPRWRIPGETLAQALLLFGSIVTLPLVTAGCGAMEKTEAQRRQQLLAMYPPGQTTRAQVQERWGGRERKWDVSETRPAASWTAATNVAVRDRVLASEQRTGKSVHRVEADLAPDGWSGGLCVCWFYYDETDRITDVEWQWHTD